MRTKLITIIILAAILSAAHLSGAEARTIGFRGEQISADKPVIMGFLSDDPFFFFGNELLKAYSATGEISVRILDINGRAVLEHYSGSSEAMINLHSLNSGIYFAILNNNPSAICKINVMK